MALESLGLTMGLTLREVNSRETVINSISASKHAITVASNLSFPGIEYYFEDLLLKWRIKNESLARSFLKSLGWSDPIIDQRLQLIRTYPVAINYEILQKWIEDCKSLFDQWFPNERKSEGVSILLTFEPTLYAGAMPLSDGASIITISSGFDNFRRWFIFRQMLNDIFPLMPLPAGGTKILITVKEQQILMQIVETLRVLSQVIMGNLSDYSRLRNSIAEQALSFFEEYAMDPAKLGPMRSEWRSALVFVICHELGHINLGHIEEIESWRKSQKKSQNSIKNLIIRRREMEKEADSYAIAHMALLMTTVLHKSYHSLADADRDPERMRDYLLPIIDLFTIFSCGHKGVLNFQSDRCPYPSYQERLTYLLSRDGQTNEEWLSLVMSSVDFIMNAPGLNA